MKKKVLFTATVDIHIVKFHLPYLKHFKDLGYEVYVASKGASEIPYVDVKYDISFQRSPLSISNFTAYRALKKILTMNFDIVHCHTPMGAAITRLAAKDLKHTTVIYTAHGFHFYKGAPLANWLLFYPVEKYLAKYTDILITINQEDYKIAQDRIKAKKIYYVPGVGIDIVRFNRTDIHEINKRAELGINQNSKILMSVGELNKNKNHEIMIKALADLKEYDLVYIICGQGLLSGYLKALAKKLGLEDKIKFLGFRSDVEEILKITNIFVFPSFREGLPVSVMEAMASGLAVVCSDIRGNRDLIKQGEGGFLVRPDRVDDFSFAVETLLKDEGLCLSMGRYNQRSIHQFENVNVMEQVKRIYSEI